MKTTKKKTKRQIKAERNRIEQAYYATCSGIQINIFDIGKVFDHGHKLLDEGADETKLREGIRAFVETIRQN